MKSFNEYINEYHRLLEEGDIQIAYRRLIEYLSQLRLYLSKQYPDFYVAGNMYQGFMDHSFFAFAPQDFRKNKLKFILVFKHEELRFDIWMCGQNKNIQAKYWNWFKANHPDKYYIPSDISGIFSIVEHILVDNPDFDDLEGLTLQIEEEVLCFIQDLRSLIL